MSRDYKAPSKAIPVSRGSGSSLLVGILIGLVLGLGIALGVAWYMNRMPSPFLNRKPAESIPGKSDATKGSGPELQRPEAKQAKGAESKPRFDFYKILPGTEEPVTDKELKEATQRPAGAQSKEGFFLQAGAFQNVPDADNLKARLALLGVEATIQTTSIPDKGIWHRVRVGPYTSVGELNRVRDNLKQNGIETTLIKVREAAEQ
jgi:cell division protein FtsN